MFEVDSFQERYMDDEDDKRWLYRVLHDLADSQFPLLKPNLENNKQLSSLLDQVIIDANKYDFIEDDELVEVTPKSVRIRKKWLIENDRKRNRAK